MCLYDDGLGGLRDADGVFFGCPFWVWEGELSQQLFLDTLCCTGGSANLAL